MKKYAVVIERDETSYGAYVPDLPGCIATARTKAEVEKLIAEAISLPLKAWSNMVTRCRNQALRLKTSNQRWSYNA